MEPFDLTIYVGEIERQAIMGGLALARLAAASELLGKPSAPRNAIDELFAAAQSVLAHEMVIVKITYNPKAADRCKTIRKALGLSPTEPPGVRAVKNSLEHFDERLDKWFLDNPDRVYVATAVGPENMVINNGKPYLYVRRYDPATGKLYVLGKEVSFVDVDADLRSFHDKAKAWRAAHPFGR